MPIRSLESHLRTTQFPLSSLRDAALGLDATYYIDVHLHKPDKEPLLTALGGFPFALKAVIEKELDSLKELGITPVFVFPGLDFGEKADGFASQASAALGIQRAWELYDQQQAEKVVDAFSKAGTVKPEFLHRYLQKILHEHKIDFLVAPYSASAQLAYLEKHPSRFIDAVYGYNDLLLFGVDKIITKLDFDQLSFSWLGKKSLQPLTEGLDRIPNDKFIDACLLLGSQYLPTFPPLERPERDQPNTLIRAINMINTLGSVQAICGTYDEREVKELGYFDRYKKAIMTLRHHVVLGFDGKVGPLNQENVPNDLHDLIGQRLPEELYFYISKGVIGPQVPYSLTSGEIQIMPPLGVGDDDEYRRLVRDQLTPLRTQSLCLLSNSLHRFYHTKVVHLKFWFDLNSDQSINLKGLPSLRDLVSKWNVKGDLLQKQLGKLQGDRVSLKFVLDCLKDSSFVSATLAPSAPKGHHKSLSTKEEILSNALWRFLQLRDFVGPDHKLTPWGECLVSAMTTINPADGLEEPIFIAVELMRLGLLNAKSFFLNLSGGPLKGSEEEKHNIVLLSRIGVIAKLRHEPAGYSGPLSRQLVAYQAVVSAVRSSLRDLMEVCLTGLLLNGEVDRDRSDWTELGLSLPFIDDNDCALGVLVKTYLDEIIQENKQTAPEVKEETKIKTERYFQYIGSASDSLGVAFKLWDSIYLGSQALGTEFKDAASWKEVDSWLSERR